MDLVGPFDGQAAAEAMGDPGTMTGIDGMGSVLAHGSGHMLAPGIALAPSTMDGMGSGLRAGTLSTGTALAPGSMLGTGIEAHGVPDAGDGAGTMDGAGAVLWPSTVAAEASTMLAASTAIDRDRGRFMTPSLSRTRARVGSGCQGRLRGGSIAVRRGHPE